MNSISLEAARCLAAATAVTSAEIRSIDGRKWMVVLRGNTDFILKSDRQNPRRFGTIETAMTEIRHLGLQRCEVNLEKWAGKTARPVTPILNLAIEDEFSA
jgi:alpha-ketoglutarate-dependent taurine dioxygenase